jgi:polyisoprenoid-binding protein YceI
MDESSNEVATQSAPVKDRRVRFVIDTKKSRFTVHAFATGILSGMGHNPTIGIRRFDGEVEFDPEKLEARGLCLIIQSASLEVQDDISDRDRREMDKMMKGDVLEAGKYPEIRYEASHIPVTKLGDALFAATLIGNLSFHGVTRSQSVPVRITSLGEMIRASGDFTLKQSDYQIKPVSVAGGALRLKDELRFSFEMVAQKQ